MEPQRFSLQPSNPVQAEVNTGVQGFRGGSTGGQISLSVINNEHSSAKALGGLLKVAVDIAAPHVKKAQEEAFLTGMQRAATGETLEQIRQDKPWYSKLFGDTPAVEGARAYKAQAATNRWATETAERMGELAAQDPSNIPVFLSESMETFANTGDEQLDNLIRKSMVEKAPELIASHTRAHVRFTQEQAVKSQLDAWDSSAIALQATGPTADLLSPAERQEQYEGYIAGLRPPPGADLAQWGSNLELHLAQSAIAGNFHAISAAEAAGILTFIPPARRIQLQQQLDAAQREWAASKGMTDYWTPEMLQRHHDVRMGRVTPADQLQHYQDVNAEYKLRTGSKVDLFPLGEVRQGVATAQTAREQVLAGEARELAKGLELGNMEATVLHGIQRRSPSTLSKMNAEVNLEEAERIAYKAFQEADPAQRVRYMMAWGTGEEVPPALVKRDLANHISVLEKGVLTDDFIAVAALYAELKKQPGGAEAAGAWFPTDRVPFIENYLKYGGLSPDSGVRSAAHEFAVRNERLSGAPRLTDQTEAAINKHIEKQTRYGGMFGWFAEHLNPTAASTLSRMVQIEVGYLQSSGLSLDSAIEQGFGAVKGRVETIGTHVALKDASTEVMPLQEALSKHGNGNFNITTENTARVFNAAIAKKLKAVGASDKADVILKREEDANGVATFSILAFEDGEMRLSSVTSLELYEALTKDRLANAPGPLGSTGGVWNLERIVRGQ